MGTIRYWLRVHKRAFADARRALFLEAGGAVVIAIFVAAIYLLLVWHFVGADEAHLELTDHLLGWLSPFLVFPAVYLWKMVSAPAEIDRDARHQLQKLKPKLRLSFTKQQGVTRIDRGSVLQSMTGDRQTIATQSEIMLRVLCTNESAIRCESCRAFLMNVMDVKDDGTLLDIGFVEPVQLSWSRDLAPATLETSLEPGIPKAIYILTRRQHPSLMVYRITKELPLEYGQLFGNHSKHRIWLQVNGANDAADVMVLDIWAIGGPNVQPPWSIGVEIISAGSSPPVN